MFTAGAPDPLNRIKPVFGAEFLGGKGALYVEIGLGEVSDRAPDRAGTYGHPSEPAVAPSLVNVESTDTERSNRGARSPRD